jgi:hypothetical protein
MPTEIKMKLFIDANIYLDFYELQAVKPLIDPLVKVSDHILITHQVVSEVFRNKLKLASKKLEEYTKKINISIALPDVLTENAIAEIDSSAGKKLQELSSSLKEFKKLLEDIYSKTIEQVSKDEDKVSVELNKIFKNSLPCSDELIFAAKKRKEFGNPPGKKEDPIGDEISWEQVLDYAKKNSYAVWVVSRDGDFMTKTFNNKIIGNPYLIREIKSKGLPEFLFFDNLASALKKFQIEIEKDLVLPSEEELAAATQAQTAPRSKPISECKHIMDIIPDGAFDIYRCNKCGSSYRIYSDECCG